VNLKKMLLGVIFIVMALYFWQYVEPVINDTMTWIHDNIWNGFPTNLGFTYYLWGFIPIPIGFGTIVLGLGVLLLIFGLFAS